METLIKSKESVIDELANEFFVKKDKNNLTWSVPELDKKFGKPKKEDLIVMCGESGSGKTTFAFNMCRDLVFKGNKVLFCTLEMSVKGLMTRFIQHYANITDESVENISYTPYQEQKITEVLEFCENENFKMLETDYNSDSGVNVDDLITDILFEAETKKFDMVFIDALQFIDGNGANEREKIDYIIGKLISFVNSEDGVPIVLLHHFTKGTEGKRDKPRAINQLMGSGKIEHKATRVVQIWRNQQDNDFDESMFLMMKDRWFGRLGAQNLQFKNSHFYAS